MPPRKRKSVEDDGSDKRLPMSIPTAGCQTSGQMVRRIAMLRAASAQTTDVQSSPSFAVGSSSSSVEPASSTLNSPGPLYLDLGSCSYFCEYCGAAFWFEERLKSSPLKVRLKYNGCCKAGAIRLRYPINPPTAIKDLYANSHFMANIRAYNSMFSMTSFGADVDDTINKTSGPYVFKVAGQISHWIGSLCPAPDTNPRFLQMYIYDTENEVSNRLRFFQDGGHSQLSADIVTVVAHVLADVNEYVRLFKSAREMCAAEPIPEFSISLHNSSGPNHIMPSTGCLGAIVRDDDPTASDYDIVIHNKEGVPKRVSKLHSSYMPLQYPLLFPFAEQGWSPHLRLYGHDDTNLTMSMFYGYQLHDRHDTYTLLLRGGRLFQQYLVDAYICIEQSRLDYVRSNQNRFRSEYLRGIHDAFLKGDTEGRHVGKRTILPSSFTGGPRYMYKHYQDALAICRVHGNPQYFITLTCNVRWPEIKRALLDAGCLNAQDRPDIIARVFQMKVNALRKFLKSRKTFGAVAADLYTIEFQKRGLPHCHMLLWVTPECKIKDTADVDRYISAEIPNSCNDPTLHRIVTESMMHGPCGTPKPNAPCMKNGKCSKLFPKSYECVTRFDKQGYVHYKRSPNTEPFVKSGVPLDNGFVVPYNPILCLHFEAHINVEYCGWSMLIKYLFKYISKGTDRICYSVTKSGEGASPSSTTADRQVNEIANFIDGRFVCPHEAAWRIFEFPIHHRNPAVQLLSVHLEHMQNIVFQDQQKLQQIVDNPTISNTTLTEWLANNQRKPDGRDLRYVDYLTRFRWDLTGKGWIRRINNINPTVGRLAYVHPSCGELFYLRMLLGHQKGCCSFEDIRRVSGTVYPTYRAACEKLGLIGDDREWSACFIEASAWATAAELRTLFTNMLLHCEISNPLDFWKQHWHQMSDDILRSISQVAGSSNTVFNEETLQQHVLYELELLLNSSSSSRSLSEFGLPLPPPSMISLLRNRLLTEEKCYDTDELANRSVAMEASLNNIQAKAYNMILDAVMQNKQLLLFIYGHGGTGKTFLWTAIINKIRSTGRIVLAVAASGIASLLLPSGRTAHSRFKIPLDLTDDSVCYIKKNTQLSELLAETSLIVWDEAPMNDRRCFESLDKSLRDIIGVNDQPFGGKSILLGGDFRQTLPVKPKATKAEVITSSLPKSHLWKRFMLIKLHENMRLAQPGTSASDRTETHTFSEWLLNVGDGKLGDPFTESPSDTKIINIPTQLLIQPGENSLQRLINFVYSNTILDNPTASNL